MQIISSISQQRWAKWAITAAWTVRGWGWKEWARVAILALLWTLMWPFVVAIAIAVCAEGLIRFAFDWTLKSKIKRVGDNGKGQTK